ncbi:hypothetical protein BgiMline_020017 [Biomphalaria glabrata]|nr:hypothetical protein BgiMline_029742 [Biomphalaria glabrata]
MLKSLGPIGTPVGIGESYVDFQMLETDCSPCEGKETYQVDNKTPPIVGENHNFQPDGADTCRRNATVANQLGLLKCEKLVFADDYVGRDHHLHSAATISLC